MNPANSENRNASFSRATVGAVQSTVLREAISQTSHKPLVPGAKELRYLPIGGRTADN